MSGTIQLGDGKGTGSKNELGGVGNAAKVVLVDPATGLPYVASSGGGGSSSNTYTLSAPVAVAITTTSAQIIPANPSRKYLMIQVNGAADVAIAPGSGAATLAGSLLLSANTSGAGFPGASFTGNHIGAVQAIGRGASSIVWSEGT